MDCSVCFNDMVNGAPPEKIMKSANGANSTDICCTPCGHLFHKKCLMDWFQTEQYVFILRNHCCIILRKILLFAIKFALIFYSDTSGLEGNAEKGTCPACRSNVNIRDLYPIYFPTNSSSQSSLTQNTSSNQPSSLFSNQNTSANKSDVELRLELLK